MPNTLLGLPFRTGPTVSPSARAALPTDEHKLQRGPVLAQWVARTEIIGGGEKHIGVIGRIWGILRGREAWPITDKLKLLGDCT